MDENEVYYGERFGQQVDLCGRIREIILSYPEGRYSKSSLRIVSDF